MKTMHSRRAYDISVVLGQESIDYPGDTHYSRDLIRTLKDGDNCNLSRLTMSPHSGTHIDFPAHFISGGKTVDQYSATDFILPASVVEIEDKEAIRSYELENLLVERGDALLFKTENSRQGWCRSGVFLEEFVYMNSDAADLCIEKEVALVGIDYISIERYGDNAFPVHRMLLRKNLLILEGIDLSQVQPVFGKVKGDHLRS